MSTLRVDGSIHGPMSLEPNSVQDEPLCPDASALRSGDWGAGGAVGHDAPLCLDGSQARMGERGAGGMPGTPSTSSTTFGGGAMECLDEIIDAAGACRATLLSAGTLAIMSGMVCIATSYQAVECLAREMRADER
nr:MAG: hypothetical protein DIU78_05195 [Pseudomonadota bacterium]